MTNLKIKICSPSEYWVKRIWGLKEFEIFSLVYSLKCVCVRLCVWYIHTHVFVHMNVYAYSHMYFYLFPWAKGEIPLDLEEKKVDRWYLCASGNNT